MNLKHRIKKLTQKVIPKSKFCICPGVFSWNLNDDCTIKIIETCERCGKKVKPFDWVEMTRQLEEAGYGETDNLTNE